MSEATAVRWERGDPFADRRFHLSFSYPNPNVGAVGNSLGDQVVYCASLEQAAARLMAERRVTRIHIKKRFYSGKPASEAEIVARDFILVP